MDVPRSFACVALLAAVLSASPAKAQTDMSFFLEPSRIQVDLGYAGLDLLVVGVVPKDADGVILTCHSTEIRPTSVVRVERVAIFWMPTKEFRVRNAPGLYLLASSKPLDELLGDQRESIAAEYGIGYRSVRGAWAVERLSGEEAPDDLDVLSSGYIALKEKEGLYKRVEGGVRLEKDGLFLCRFHIPDRMRIGSQTVTAYAIKDHQVIRTFRQELEVERAGAARWLFDLANHHSALYGIVAVVVATAAGLGAGKLFAGRGRH